MLQKMIMPALSISSLSRILWRIASFVLCSSAFCYSAGGPSHFSNSGIHTGSKSIWTAAENLTMGPITVASSLTDKMRPGEHLRLNIDTDLIILLRLAQSRMSSSIAVLTSSEASSTMNLVSYYTCYTSTFTESNLVQCWFDFPRKHGAWAPQYWDPYTSITDTALRSQCLLQFSKGYSSFLATGSVVPAKTTWWNNGGGYVESPSYANDWTFTASSPCCSTCSLSGGNVQVQYWPTPAPTPNVTALVDENGFTL